MKLEAQLNEILENYAFNANQIAIIRGILRGKKYEEIGEQLKSNKDSIKTQASKIFKRMNEVERFIHPINKRNLRQNLEQKQIIFVQKRRERLENPVGEVPLDSKFYVERFQEKWLEEKFLLEKEPIRIEGERGEGKSSLAMRIRDKASKSGLMVVSFNFRFDLNNEKIKNFDDFLKWFCSAISSRLGIPNCVEEYWDSELGGQDNSGIYLEDYLLPQIKKDLVLSLDRLELIDSKYVENFLVCLRAWHSKGRTERNSLFTKLRLILIYTGEIPGISPAQSGVNNSPFNLGAVVTLKGLTLDEVNDLAQRHQLNWNELEVKRFVAEIGANPALIREAFYQIANENLSLDEFLKY